ISPNDHAIGVEHLAAALIANGAADEAIPALEQTLAKAGELTDPDLIADLKFDLAKALWSTGRDKARAKQLARAALATYRKTPELVDEIAEAVGWLRSR
ncbi:MAG TPA: hypothetical protein VIV11_38050, partial [Kofleriaceae bacterium]